MDENPYKAPQTDPRPGNDLRDSEKWRPVIKNANARKFTPAQVLCGLKQLWPGLTGTDSSFSYEMRIDEHLKKHGMWDEIDFADVIKDSEKFFGFQCAIDEWVSLFRFDSPPTLTFGELAQFIADRAPFVSLEPASVFGQPCKAAGAFLGVQQVASQIRPTIESFGPSTRILARLRGRKLDAFWERVRWISENGIPALSKIWRDVAGYAVMLGILLFFSGLIASYVVSNPAYAVTGLLAASVLYGLSTIFVYVVNPLPDGIDTFGDLARFLASQRPS